MSAQLKTTIKYPGSLIRPRFEPGALLLDEDLTAIVDHTRGLSRLLFRSLFGCGVVCGFRVTAQVECGNLTVAVAPGVAIDCKGDPIEMCGQQTLGMPCAERLPDHLWVLIRRSARDHTCATRDVACPSDDSGAYKPTRAKDCFELTLTKDDPKHECGCPKPPGATTTTAGTTGTYGVPAGATGTYAMPAATGDISAMRPAPTDASSVAPAATIDTSAMRLATTGTLSTASAATIDPAAIHPINTDTLSAASAPTIDPAHPVNTGTFSVGVGPAGVIGAGAIPLGTTDGFTSTTQPATAGGAIGTPAAGLPAFAEPAPAPPADWQCHIPHYCGVCSCGCCDSCGDGWVVLACVSTKPKATLGIAGTAAQTNNRDVDYTVRRFIRPVLAADPLRYPERDTMCNRLLAAKPDGG